MRQVPSWTEYYFSLCETVSLRSKDPNTQVGCVIVRPDYTIASVGFNGFPRGIVETPERWSRPTKYQFVKHAEENALLAARQDLTGCTLYVTIPPCLQCAGSIIQAGISRVYVESITARPLGGLDLLIEGGVKVLLKSY